jgi:hypothetical protein
MNNNFFFVHNTFGYDNLIDILSSGILKKGSDVEQNKRKLSGGIPLDNIFMNIYFENMEKQYEPCGLIFSSNILNEYNISVNAGWGGKEICSINYTDETYIKNNKLDEIKDFIMNPEKILNPNLVKLLTNNIMLHEVLFFENIPLDKYLIKIIICGFTDTQKNEIKKIIKNKQFNVTILQ